MFCLLRTQNPNPHETKNNMSFEDAYKKESWFFDELFAPVDAPWSGNDEPAISEGTPFQEPQPEPEPGTDEPVVDPAVESNPRRLCGIDGFRSALVGKFADFATEHVKSMAPKVFQMVMDEENYLTRAWGWSTDEENYDDKQCLIGVLQESVRQLLNEGRSLNASNVLENTQFKRIFETSLTKKRPDQTEGDLQKPMTKLLTDMITRADRSAQENKYRRFPYLMKDLLEACKVMMGLCLSTFQEKLHDDIVQASKLMQESKAPNTTAVPHVVYEAQKDLVDLATMIARLPKLPLQILPENPAPQLAHAKLMRILHNKDDDGKFGLKLAGAKVTEQSSRRGDFPVSCTVVECMGRPLDFGKGNKAIKKIAEYTAGVPNGGVALFTYCKSASLIDDTNLELADWLLPDNLNQEYRSLRDQLMRRRRVAELLMLVFDEDTAAVPERKAYEDPATSEAARRPLVRLGKKEGQYTGMQLQAPNFADAAEASLKNDGHDTPLVAPASLRALPGFCSTPGCYRPADAACKPCGHAVCCWDCLNEIKLQPQPDGIHKDGGCCPVCNVVMTATFLCYEPPADEVRDDE